MNNFLNAIQNRRSYYAISNEEILSKEDILEIVERSLKYSPSAFNSQSSRVVVLFGDAHKKLWDITLNTLKGIVPATAFSSTQAKIDSFAAGYGSILYYEDEDTIKNLQTSFPNYAQNFPIWSQQASGMLQLVIWTALEEGGEGASLQHYNPIIDVEVAAAFDIPKNWKLVSQMPFGKPCKSADDKTFIPKEDRIKVMGL